MKTFPALAITLVCMTLGCFRTGLAEETGFDSQAEELLYYWGASFGQQVKAAGIERDAEVDWIARGLKDQAAGKAPAFGEEYRSLLNNFLVQRRKEMISTERKLADAFLNDMAKEKGAVKLESGIVYRELEAGAGESPTPGSKVRVHYVGKLRDGEAFDSSRERGAPFETRLTQVIGCWKEAIVLMKPGGRALIGCPADRAYGDRGTPTIPPGAALAFDVELLEVLD
jgi:FKBP-type peptidyl-prolyl cis-trans isomerase FkpA